MIKHHLLAKIYHDLGKQTTNFSLQHSWLDGADKHFTKRRTFLDLDPAADDWFIQSCNHRQILLNEIIVDFDRPIPRETALQDPEIAELLRELIDDEWRFVVYHTGSKGVHVHIYNDRLSTMQRQERETFRLTFLQNFNLTGVDLQLKSDNVMIALEHVPHWKTGQMKTVLFNHGVRAWM